MNAGPGIAVLWGLGLLRRRPGRVAVAAAGVAVAVALLASLGAFLISSRATMTARAVQDVGVDWQVQVQVGADPTAVRDLVRTAPGTRDALPVGFRPVDGLTATTATTATATTQTTGAAVVVGLPARYRTVFPHELRTLVGADEGVLLAQQTAANLGVAPGDAVTIALPDGTRTTVVVDGVVELLDANALFQTVGAPPGSQPSAPPDNVVLLPEERWQHLSAPPASAAAVPDGVQTQLHVARAAALAADPASAYVQESQAAHNLEAAAAGTAVVGDNLGAALDAARTDAAYAQILFLFLGLPGAVLAGLVTAAVAGAAAPRRRQEQALARTRGASTAQILRLAAVEAVLVGAVGALVGLAAAAVVRQVAFAPAPGTGVSSVTVWAWAAGATLAGMVIAMLAVLVPAWRDLRHTTVAGAWRELSPAHDDRLPWWARGGLDLLLLAAGALLVRVASSPGRELVLAPEGAPTIAVSYWAFAGPALLWIGTGLLAWRLTELALRRAGPVRSVVRPVAGRLASTAAAMLSRRRRLLARAVALLGTALAFAASTATFNATYQVQAEADAQLTNGADVAVTEPPAAPVDAQAAAALAAVPGVRAVEPLQHRFAYIGTDLQDLYGVRPGSITRTTALQDGYFQGGSARTLMDTLRAAPDSILVSAETVQDYRLSVGDAVNLRLLDGATKRLTTVAFRYAGIVKEFPTAPRDSFFVANADYVAARTGSAAIGTFLVDTGGRDTAGVADRIRSTVGTSAGVTDIAHSRSRIASSLTAVDLAALTRVELGFALVLAAAAGGLVAFLGLAERRRSFAITRLLGATTRQLRGLVRAEVAVLAVGGLLAGAAAGWVLSQVLVAVLTGVFDPPPDAVTVPWPYLLGTAVISVVALLVAAESVPHRRGGDDVELLREP